MSVEDHGTAPCWYGDCPERIPRRREFVPTGDGMMQERFVPDERLMNAHLATHRKNT